MTWLSLRLAGSCLAVSLSLLGCPDDGSVPGDAGGRDRDAEIDGSLPPTDGSLPPTDGAVPGRCGSEAAELVHRDVFDGKPCDILEHGDNLYVTDCSGGLHVGAPMDGNLLMIPKDGRPLEVIDSEGNSAEQVAVFDDDLYWINRSPAGPSDDVSGEYVLRTSPIAALAPRTLRTFHATDFGLEAFYGNAAALLEVNGDGVFMNIFGRYPDGSPEVRDHFLVRVALSGDSYDIVARSGPIGGPLGGPLDSTHSYSFETEFLVHSLVRTPTAGGASITLCECDGRFPQVGASHIYFFMDTAVWRVAKGGGALEKLGITPPDVQDLTLTDTHLYYITNTVIGRVPLGGGLSTLLAGVTSSAATALTTDGECLYWADRDSAGGVYSLAIPPG